MKFDCVIGNPPYQDPKNKRSPLWQKFVEMAFDLTKAGGNISLIHPSSWRKPEHKLFDLFTENNLKYLEIHNQKDGQAVFGAGTRYDWYVLEKCENEGETIIIDENNKKIVCDIEKMGCIPHHSISYLNSIIADDKKEACEVVYSRSSYATDKKWVSFKKNEKHIYPCVHSTKSSGAVMVYSNTNKNGHFGVKKVIMGMASPENGFYDKDGVYGISQNSFAIKVNNDKDGESLCRALRTDKFGDLFKLFKWSGFVTEYRAFRLLKYGFWREFI